MLFPEIGRIGLCDDEADATANDQQQTLCCQPPSGVGAAWWRE